MPLLLSILTGINIIKFVLCSDMYQKEPLHLVKPMRLTNQHVLPTPGGSYFPCVISRILPLANFGMLYPSTYYNSQNPKSTNALCSEDQAYARVQSSSSGLDE